MHIGLLFTYGYSLNTWKESGTLNREVLFYKKLAEEHEMISPFVSESISKGISHGLNSFGYDLRCGSEF